MQKKLEMTTRESAGKDEMVKGLRCEVTNQKMIVRVIIERGEAIDKKKSETIRLLEEEVQSLKTVNEFQQNLLDEKNKQIEKLLQHLQAKNEECKKVKDLQNQLFQCKEWAGKRAIDIAQMKKEFEEVKTSKLADQKLWQEKLLSAQRMVSQKSKDIFQLQKEMEALKEEVEALKKENEKMSESGKDENERSKLLIVSLNKSLAYSRKEIDDLTLQLRSAKMANLNAGNNAFNFNLINCQTEKV